MDYPIWLMVFNSICGLLAYLTLSFIHEWAIIFFLVACVVNAVYVSELLKKKGAGL